MAPIIPLITSIFSAVKAGKETVDEITKDPDVQAEMNNVQTAYANELQSGDNYTRRARPTLIYLIILLVFNDLFLRPYVNALFAIGIPVLLTEDKFRLLIMLASALGIARSVFDKQGKWLEKLLSKVKE
jgi:hypothetical protein